MDSGGEVKRSLGDLLIIEHARQGCRCHRCAVYRATGFIGGLDETERLFDSLGATGSTRDGSHD